MAEKIREMIDGFRGPQAVRDELWDDSLELDFYVMMIGSCLIAWFVCINMVGN